MQNPNRNVNQGRYGQHSLKRNILGKEFTLDPAERENYVRTWLKADLATENIREQKRELGTVCRFDDAMWYRVNTLDLSVEGMCASLLGIFLIYDLRTADYRQAVNAMMNSLRGRLWLVP